MFKILKTLFKLVSYREEILQIQQQITLLINKTQAATFFKEAYEKCYETFKRQVAQPGSSFAKRV